jgi:hypothetical protein
VPTQEREALRALPHSRPDQAAAPESNSGRSVRVLAAQLDLGARARLSNGDIHASAELRGLHVETRVNLGGDSSAVRCLFWRSACYLHKGMLFFSRKMLAVHRDARQCGRQLRRGALPVSGSIGMLPGCPWSASRRMLFLQI